MDETQAGRLIDAVNWAVAEHNLKVQGRSRTDDAVPEWQQSLYGAGLPTDQVETVDWWDTDEKVLVLCTTGCCIAGNIAVQNGGRLVVRAEEYPQIVPSEEMYSDVVLTEDRTVRSVSAYALDLIGLTTDIDYSGSVHQFDSLFASNNTIHDVIRIAGNLLKEHGHELTLTAQPLPSDEEEGA